MCQWSWAVSPSFCIQAEFLEAESGLRAQQRDKRLAFRAGLDHMVELKAERKKAEEQQTQAEDRDRELFCQTKKVCGRSFRVSLPFSPLPDVSL